TVAAGGPGPASGEGPATGAWTALAAGVLYLALVSTALAFFLWNRGFELLNAASASLFFLLQPLVGAALGVLLLGEPSGPELWLGGLLILLGVAVASHGQRPAASTPRRTAAGGAG
ncbi:MAG: EamA family transporter, partial [Bacillota bacterium]